MLGVSDGTLNVEFERNAERNEGPKQQNQV